MMQPLFIWNMITFRLHIISWWYFNIINPLHFNDYLREGGRTQETVFSHNRMLYGAWTGDVRIIYVFFFFSSIQYSSCTVVTDNILGLSDLSQNSFYCVLATRDDRAPPPCPLSIKTTWCFMSVLPTAFPRRRVGILLSGGNFLAGVDRH